MKFALALIALSLSVPAAAQPCRTKAVKSEVAKSVRAPQPTRGPSADRDRLGWLRSELFWRQVL